jgi:aminoglycoside phosphotransferase (APT) family kinase protein
VTATLPRGAREAVAAATAALGLENPEVSELAGGAANRTWRVIDARHDLVLKIPGGAARALGGGGDPEFAMQSLASSNGLAPPIVLVDRARGFIVSRHAAGAVPALDDMRRAPLLRRVGNFLARLHALPPPANLPAVDFGERAAGYLERLAGGHAAALGRELGRRRAALGAPARLAPCHHDLHHRNLIDGGGRLLAVDWEYAGPGDPAADLAACIGYHGLDGEQAGALYAGYGAADPALRARVAALGWIFDCLWFGWNAAAVEEGLAPDPGEQARLAARLAG